MELKDVCLIVVGLLNEERYVDELVKSYKDVSTTKILSTWPTENPAFLKRLKDEANFIVIFNEHPLMDNKHPSLQLSTNFQIRTVSNALKKADELGFKYIMKFRTDLICDNIPLLFNTIKHLFQDKICVLARIEEKTCPKKNFIDQFVSGPIKDMVKMYSSEIKDIAKSNYWPEDQLQENYFGKLDVSYEEFKENINMCLPLVRKCGVKIRWLRQPYTYYGRDLDFINEHPCTKDAVRFN
jgi:hypothetical protein